MKFSLGINIIIWCIEQNVHFGLKPETSHHPILCS